MKRLGVIGSMVWDTIYGRDAGAPAIQEWGGIAYALAALDATLSEGWEIVPLIKVGRDLAPNANLFLHGLRRTAHGSRFIEVPESNNRVTLRYLDAQRRTERMEGGVPPWTWPELGPLVADLDGLYINFISGFELDLRTAGHLRRAFPRFVYADLHSLFLEREPDGTRVLQPLPQASEWFGCFDVVQLNEEEFAQLGGDPMTVAAAALTGCAALCVTLGPRGVAYFNALRPGAPVRSGLVGAEPVATAAAGGGDPTGCGDVLGAATCASLLAGASLEDALREGVRMAARNLTHRGASGLREHLLGHLSTA